MKLDASGNQEWAKLIRAPQPFYDGKALIEFDDMAFLSQDELLRIENFPNIKTTDAAAEMTNVEYTVIDF
jgi:hypothetical protein